MSIKTDSKHLLKDLCAVSNRKKLPLSSLLPYDPAVKTKSRLKNGIDEYRMLLYAAEQTIQNLQLGNFSAIDPLVGENVCQIRALKNAIIFSKISLTFDLENELIQKAQGKLNSMEAELPTLLQSGVSLKDLLADNLEIKLTEDLLYLICSYVLTTVKVIGHQEGQSLIIKDYTDKKKIREISPVSSLFAKRIVQLLRELLAHQSVAFIQECAENLSDPIIESVSGKYLIRDRGLTCLPYYWVFSPLLYRALKNQIPIVVIARQAAADQNNRFVRETTFFLQPTQSGYKITHSHLEPNQSALVLTGVTLRKHEDLPNLKTWRKEIEEVGLINILYAHAASHRQYPDNLDHEISKIPDLQYQYYKCKADEWGCSLNNPSLLFFKHCYCDLIRNINANAQVNSYISVE